MDSIGLLGVYLHPGRLHLLSCPQATHSHSQEPRYQALKVCKKMQDKTLIKQKIICVRQTRKFDAFWEDKVVRLTGD